MRTLLATLTLALTTAPAPAADRYAGYYNMPCGSLVCDLRIRPAGADRWQVTWEAIDPRDPSLTPVCRLEASVAIGTAVVGDIPVSGIAVGEVRGRPLAVFHLDPGRVSIRTPATCGGIQVDGIYEMDCD